MDIGKQQIFLQRRKERATQVSVVFCDSNSFVVVKVPIVDGELKMTNVKYFGRLDPDSCTCASFYHGNSEDYQRLHPNPFQCKHILKAREARHG